MAMSEFIVLSIPDIPYMSGLRWMTWCGAVTRMTMLWLAAGHNATMAVR